MIIHRVFLFWLLYLVIVLFGLGVLIYLRLPQLALHYDHSYLTVLLDAPSRLTSASSIEDGRKVNWP